MTKENYENIIIKKGTIVDFEGDAVVNAANKHLSDGRGVCGAIFNAAGNYELGEACRKLGDQEIGSATITDGFKLKAKYIIHTVGPIYDRLPNPEEVLAKAYKNTFDVAIKNNIKTIALPSISTGIYGFPLEKACPIALKEIINRSKDFDKIAVYCYDDRTYDMYVKTLEELKNNK